MLILTRKVGEVLKIGDDIEVRVMSVHRYTPTSAPQVRIGIKAPKEVPVHREEIYQRIKKETGTNGAG